MSANLKPEVHGFHCRHCNKPHTNLINITSCYYDRKEKMNIDNDPKDYAISYMEDDGFSLTNPMTLKEAMKTLTELRDMDVMCSLEYIS